MKTPKHYQNILLETIVGGGQAIGTLENGKKAFVWGGLPGETVDFTETKRKSRFVEGVVTNIVMPSKDRIAPKDQTSYLSTSPWQIMAPSAEQRYKAALVEEAFELHNIVLPDPISVYTNGTTEHYRNKVEFSWYSDVDPSTGNDTLDLAFFRRGSSGKITIDQCSLLPSSMMQLAIEIRDFLRTKQVSARQLKTLVIRCDQAGNCVWQLYSKEPNCDYITQAEMAVFTAQGGEVIFSDPKSPASIITKRLLAAGDVVLRDTLLDVEFRYATEGFFQVNIPVYEKALKDMSQWIDNKPLVDMYAGVGSIGLTIAPQHVTLVELNEDAVREMKHNIKVLKRQATAKAVLAASENALEYITADATIVVDPPRAGLHKNVVEALIEKTPPRILYLSCNPVTQARDIELLCKNGVYGIRHHQGYNFFPRTPHIEHFAVLDLVNG